MSRDWTNREKIADLLLFESHEDPGRQVHDAGPICRNDAGGAEGDLVSHRRGPGADRAFAVSGGVPRQGQDVLLFTDPIDEFTLPSLGEYKGKKLQAVDRGEPEESKDEAANKTAVQERFQKLFDSLRSKLSEVSDIRLSSRLKRSSCLVATAGGMSARPRALMQRMGRSEELGSPRRILELNGEHPAVLALRSFMKTMLKIRGSKVMLACCTIRPSSPRVRASPILPTSRVVSMICWCGVRRQRMSEPPWRSAYLSGAAHGVSGRVFLRLLRARLLNTLEQRH